MQKMKRNYFIKNILGSDIVFMCINNNNLKFYVNNLGKQNLETFPLCLPRSSHRSYRISASELVSCKALL